MEPKIEIIEADPDQIRKSKELPPIYFNQKIGESVLDQRQKINFSFEQEEKKNG